MIFGLGASSGVVDDDVIDYVFGQGRLSLDGEGNLKLSKLEPMELDEHNHRHMYRSRVLEGDLPLVPTAPIL